MKAPALKRILDNDFSPRGRPADRTSVDQDLFLLDAYSRTVVQSAEKVSPSVVFIEATKLVAQDVKPVAAARGLCSHPTASF